MTHLKKFRVLWILLAILILLAAVLLSSGCNVMKGKKSTTSDSTRVTTDNTGAVKSSEAGSEKESDYTRRTWIYGLPGASPAYMQTRNGQRLDTIALQPEVKNYYNTLPIAYIEESGSKKKRPGNLTMTAPGMLSRTALAVALPSQKRKRKRRSLAGNTSLRPALVPHYSS
jgi:predicted small secreted protein